MLICWPKDSCSQDHLDTTDTIIWSNDTSNTFLKSFFGSSLSRRTYNETCRKHRQWASFGEIYVCTEPLSIKKTRWVKGDEKKFSQTTQLGETQCSRIRKHGQIGRLLRSLLTYHCLGKSDAIYRFITKQNNGQSSSSSSWRPPRTRRYCK